MNVDRFQRQNQPTLISTAAERFARYQRSRFISLSSRPGQWAKLKDSTVERKERRGIADNSEWILREYDVMLNAIGVKIIGKRTYVGFVRDRRHPRGKMISQLVRIHSLGLRNLPIRKPLGLPNRSTMRKMVEDVRDRYNRIIRQNRGKK